MLGDERRPPNLKDWTTCESRLQMVKACIKYTKEIGEVVQEGDAAIGRWRWRWSRERKRKGNRNKKKVKGKRHMKGFCRHMGAAHRMPDQRTQGKRQGVCGNDAPPVANFRLTGATGTQHPLLCCLRGGSWRPGADLGGTWPHKSS